jgi:hypothetical protein
LLNGSSGGESRYRGTPQLDESSILAHIEQTYRQAAGAWQGCDWPVRFGKLGLELTGLKSSQAALMAAATAGREAEEWRRAAKWLNHVEEEAREAEGYARTAVTLACEHSFKAALAEAATACKLESRYHAHPIWQPFHDAIASQLHQ